MVKNITVGISNELSESMELFNEVNWSAITRDCIEQYIKQRTSEGFENAIAQIKSKKSNEFKAGFEFLLRKIEKIDLGVLEYIAYFESRDPIDQDNFYDYLESLRDELEPGFDIMDIKISSDFRNGMRASAKEILKRSN